MESSDRIKPLAEVSAVFTLDSIADLLSVTGTLCSLLSGASMAFSFLLNQELFVDYYANGGIAANTTASLTFNSAYGNYSDHEYNLKTLEEKYTGNVHFNLASYINTKYIHQFVFTSIITGILFKSISSVLRTWTRYKKDGGMMNANLYSKPSWSEYSNQAIYGALSAATTFTVTATLASTALCLEQLKIQFYYPMDGITLADGNGIERLMEILSDRVENIIHFEFSTIPQNQNHTASGRVNFTMHTNLDALVAYGATVYNEKIKNENQLFSPAASAAITAAISSALIYPASRFFKTMAEQERLKRLKEMILSNKDDYNNNNPVNWIDDPQASPWELMV